MRCIIGAVVMTVLVLPVKQISAQNQKTPTPSRPAQTSQGQAAMEKAAKSGKYIFIFFWKEKNPQADAAYNTFLATMPKHAGWADSIAILVTDPAEKSLVDHFNVSRAPMPLVLALAPNGAVTKALTGKLDEKKFAEARVGPSTAKCLKSLQERKLVFLCVQKLGEDGKPAEVPQGVQEFKADKQFARATEVILINAGDRNESVLLKDLQVDAKTTQPVAVLLAPPGVIIGKFNPQTTKTQIVGKLAAAQSSCCPGGKCGPGGCGPKK
ncbi:MAG: hypothetical protein JXB10_07740 [Pirellulales bacterium]|nr:hypothetical protein [Pirellulales bacterium]